VYGVDLNIYLLGPSKSIVILLKEVPVPCVIDQLIGILVNDVSTGIREDMKKLQDFIVNPSVEIFIRSRRAKPVELIYAIFLVKFEDEYSKLGKFGYLEFFSVPHVDMMPVLEIRGAWAKDRKCIQIKPWTNSNTPNLKWYHKGFISAKINEPDGALLVEPVNHDIAWARELYDLLMDAIKKQEKPVEVAEDNPTLGFGNSGMGASNISHFAFPNRSDSFEEESKTNHWHNAASSSSGPNRILEREFIRNTTQEGVLEALAEKLQYQSPRFLADMKNLGVLFLSAKSGGHKKESIHAIIVKGPKGQLEVFTHNVGMLCVLHRHCEAVTTSYDVYFADMRSCSTGLQPSLLICIPGRPQHSLHNNSNKYIIISPR
jgi:hypothetical protein